MINSPKSKNLLMHPSPLPFLSLISLSQVKVVSASGALSKFGGNLADAFVSGREAGNHEYNSCQIKLGLDI